MIEHLIVQWFHLTVRVVGVLGLGLLAGWGFTLLLLPRRLACEWIVFAPIIGLAILTVIGLPLSIAGLPVKTFIPPLIAVLATVGIGQTITLKRKHSLLRDGRSISYLRARLFRLFLIGGLVTTIATGMMTTGARSDVRDIWGSGDYVAYWAVTDYLIHHGGNKASYDAQNEYRSNDISAHLVLHARLGNMVYLAAVGESLEPDHPHRLINPVIVATMILLVALSAEWLEINKCRSFWPILIVCCHPFLYFLLYFSYASQATGVLLTFASIVVANEIILAASLCEV
jgi:hypothetical protein